MGSTKMSIEFVAFAKVLLVNALFKVHSLFDEVVGLIIFIILAGQSIATTRASHMEYKQTPKSNYIRTSKDLFFVFSTNSDQLVQIQRSGTILLVSL